MVVEMGEQVGLPIKAVMQTVEMEVVVQQEVVELLVEVVGLEQMDRGVIFLVVTLVLNLAIMVLQVLLEMMGQMLVLLLLNRCYLFHFLFQMGNLPMELMETAAAVVAAVAACLKERTVLALTLALEMVEMVEMVEMAVWVEPEDMALEVLLVYT